MSQDNVFEVVQRAFESWSRADIDAFLAHVCFDVEAVPVGAALEGRVCRGHDEVRAWLQAQSEVWETFLVCAEEFEPVGTELVVSGHWEAVGRSGAEVSAPANWVFGFRDGKIAYWQAYTSRAGRPRSGGAAKPDFARRGLGVRREPQLRRFCSAARIAACHFPGRSS